MRSLRSRLTLCFFASTTLLTSLMSFATWRVARDEVTEGIDAALRGRAEFLAAMCEWDEARGELRLDALPELDWARLMNRRPCDFEVWQVNPWRLVVRSGNELPRHGTNEVLEERLSDKVSRARYHTLQQGSTFPRRMATVLVEVPLSRQVPSPVAAANVAVLIRLAVDTREELRELESVAWMYGAGALVAAALLGGFGYLLAYRFTKPIVALEEAARAAKPEAEVALPRSGRDDEVDRLAVVLERSFHVHRDALLRQARFTSDAAHELRSPLAAMRASAEVALRRERSREDYEDFFREILTTLRAMDDSVTALLELARIEVSQHGGGPVDLVAFGDIARECVDALDPAQRERVDLTDETPLALVPGHYQLLRILIGNLIRNALQYSPEEARVDVRIGVRGAALELAVRDRGRGLTPEEAERVFDRFYRAPEVSSAVKGSGLGLSVARAIAEQHGATLSLEPAHPGTRAIGRFPVLPASAEPASFEEQA